MNSLYTDDIPGASPRIRHYEKKLIRQRHAILNPYTQHSSYSQYIDSTQPNALYPSQHWQNYQPSGSQQQNLRSSMVELPNSRIAQGHSGNIIDWSPVKLDSRQSRLRSQQRSQRDKGSTNNNNSYLVNNIYGGSSNLSQLGRKSIMFYEKPEKTIQKPQPYFPHYFNAYKDHDKNLFTGHREWNPQNYNKVICIPSMLKNSHLNVSNSPTH